jgi:hypothetical protein
LLIARRVLLAFLVTLFLGCLFVSVGTELYYASYRPETAQPENGRTLRVTLNHGSHVYLTQQESDRLDFVKGPLLLIMMADFAAIGLWKVFKKDLWN